MTIPGEIEVRLPQETDAQAFVRLQRAAFPWAVDRNPVEGARAFFRSIGDGGLKGYGAFLVAEVDGRFAGYASAQPFAPWVDGKDLISPDTTVAVVPQVAVTEDHRGAGVGSRLIKGLVDELAQSRFSLAIAHIRPDLRDWYAGQGRTVLPDRHGFAWIDPPSVINARSLPAEAPPQVVATHTPLLHQAPMAQHWYSTLAFVLTGAPMRALAAAYYESDGIEDGRRTSGSSPAPATDFRPRVANAIRTPRVTRRHPRGRGRPLPLDRTDLWGTRASRGGDACGSDGHEDGERPSAESHAGG